MSSVVKFVLHLIHCWLYLDLGLPFVLGGCSHEHAIKRYVLYKVFLCEICLQAYVVM